MAIAYLKGQPWWEWSRDERMFCAVLWEHGRKDPAGFARWLNEAAELEIDTAGDWDLGYEVVFYRDYLWRDGGSAQEKDMSPKRTFDLCLFGENDLVIIEAKLCSGFESEQNKSFEKDLSDLSGLLGKQSPRIHLVGLACSEYWTNLKKRGKPETRKLFKNRFDWKQVAEHYKDPILARADGMYGKELVRKRDA